MVKAVIFDCFGVLVGKGFWHVYKILGGDPLLDYAFIEDVLTKANLGQITEEVFRGTICARVGCTIDEYMTAFDEDERPDEVMFEFIRTELKPHYKIGLLSNANKGIVEQKIPPALMKEIFDVVVISGDVGIVKPDPAIFQLTAEKLKIKPETAVFIDDRSNYLGGATSIGMHTIHYKDFEELKTDLSKLTGKHWKV